MSCFEMRDATNNNKETFGKKNSTMSQHLRHKDLESNNNEMAQCTLRKLYPSYGNEEITDKGKGIVINVYDINLEKDKEDVEELLQMH